MYKKKGTDSPDGLLPIATPSTPVTPPGNLDSKSKSSKFAPDTQKIGKESDTAEVVAAAKPKEGPLMREIPKDAAGNADMSYAHLLNGLDDGEIRNMLIEIMSQGGPKEFYKKHRAEMAKDWEKQERDFYDAEMHRENHISLDDYEAREEHMNSRVRLDSRNFEAAEAAENERRANLMAEGDPRFKLGDPNETFDERRDRAKENRGTVMPGLNDAEVKIVEVPRHGYIGERILDQARKAAKERYSDISKDADGNIIYDKDGNPKRTPKLLHYNNHGVAFDYVISSSSVKESTSEKALNKTKENGGNLGVHVAVLDNLDKVISEAIEIEEHPDMPHDADGNRIWDEKRMNENILMHRFVGAVRVDGENYEVKITFKEPKNSDENNKTYTYEVDTIEVLDNESPSTPNGPNNAASSWEGPYSVAKLIQNDGKSYDKGINLLEESRKADAERAKMETLGTDGGSLPAAEQRATVG